MLAFPCYKLQLATRVLSPKNLGGHQYHFSRLASNAINLTHTKIVLPHITLSHQYRALSTTTSTPQGAESNPPQLQFPDDPKVQATLLAELNKQGQYSNVIERVASGKYATNEGVIKEYVRALVASGKLEDTSIRDVMERWLGQPGRTPENPIYVNTQHYGRWQRIISATVSVGFAILLIFLLIRFSANGLPGQMFSSVHRELPAVARERMSDVKGNEEAKEEIQDLIEYLKDPSKFTKLGVKMPKGVLLVGPPGTGKTLLARALAGEAGVPFYFTSGSEFEEMLVGVGASRVRKLFKEAQMHSPCIIFIDEIDAMGSRREALGNKTSMTLNQLLVELDGFSQSEGVLVVAATNLPEVLDPALIRPGRFDRQVFLDLPDKKAREEILLHYMKDKKGADVNVELIARTSAGLSGADLFNIVNWAAIEATKKGLSTVSEEMLEAALENATLGRHRKSLVISESTKRLTAYHEAGHALVSLYTPGASVIHKATLVPRGHALGMVHHLAKDDPMLTRREMLASMDSAMGGRAAEELIFGDDNITQGALSDFKQATKGARLMVTKLGMSEKIGKVYFEDSEMGKVSEDTCRKIDSAVRELTDQAFARAKNLLNKHINELHLLANALLEHETLSLEDIKMVVGGSKPIRHLPTEPNNKTP